MDLIGIQAIIESEGVILLITCLVPREEYVKPFLSSAFSCFLSPCSADVIHSSVILPEPGISVGNVLCPGFLEVTLSALSVAVWTAGGRSAGLLLEGSSI